MGMLVDKANLGFGPRSWRYSMLVEDGTIKKMFIEPQKDGDPFEVSDADTMLKFMNPNAEATKSVAIFTKPGCPYCAAAKELLTKKGMQYEEIVLGKDATSVALRSVTGKGNCPSSLYRWKTHRWIRRLSKILRSLIVKKVDVAIIGAGTAGLSARREVEKITNSYVVIDDGPLGTTCARVGCMPSKVLIQVADDFHRRGKLSEEGILGGEKLTVDSKQVMKHVRKLRDRFVRSVLQGHESWRAEHLIRGRATFTSKNTLKVGEETIEAKSIIIGSGSRPIIPPAWQKYKKYLIDTDQFFELEDLPKEIGLVGLGVIGIELGSSAFKTWS
jgi:glutaredoxin